MKSVLRICGLIALVALASRPTAQALSGTCKIRCYNGTTYSFLTIDGPTCCQLIAQRCPGGGTGSFNGFACLIPP